MAKTNAQKQADWKKRQRDAGFVQKQVWVKPSWWPKVKRLIDRLTA